MKIFLYVLAVLFLMTIEILRVYFIMPFPGSQEDETIRVAYFIHQNILYFRIAGWLFGGYMFFILMKSSGQISRVVLWVMMSVYGIVFYSFNFRFLADKMFLQPTTISFAKPIASKVSEKQLVLGVSINNQSKAYPIEIIGYHHQVRDTLAGQPIMVTYCTVCRTGRVYRPEVDGKLEDFRLVGMDHYNAMFEDKTTGSWWRQVSGEAIVGELKGKQLPEISAEQMTLAAWIAQHPKTSILQPDSAFKAAYESLKDYDEGKMAGRLENKDSLSWNDKSWVVGTVVNGKAKAYDWNDLLRFRLIMDDVDGETMMVTLEKDSATFHVLSRRIDDEPNYFVLSADSTNMYDELTNSTWTLGGQCIEGKYAGKKLEHFQSYQEYWHSWRLFRGEAAYHPPR